MATTCTQMQVSTEWWVLTTQHTATYGPPAVSKVGYGDLWKKLQDMHVGCRIVGLAFARGQGFGFRVARGFSMSLVGSISEAYCAE